MSLKNIQDEIELLELTINQSKENEDEDGKLSEELIQLYEKKMAYLKAFLIKRN